MLSLISLIATTAMSSFSSGAMLGAGVYVVSKGTKN